MNKKILLVDFNGLAVRVLSAIKFSDLTPEGGKYLILNSLLTLKQRFKDYTCIICNDNSSWRRDYFPYYKAKRRKAVEKDIINWKSIYNIIDETSADLKNEFGWCCLNIHKCEADDIIAVLANHLPADYSIVIASRDKDLYQLTKRSNVRQYDPFTRKYITMDLPPLAYLNVQIATGDSGDGVPNMLSADECFVSDIRQTPLRKSKILEYLAMVGEDEKITKYYMRNKTLIDLDCIPYELVQTVIEAYTNYEYHKSSNIFNYCYQNKLTRLLPLVNALMNSEKV
jgi:5'-3' exonuclease